MNISTMHSMDDPSEHSGGDQPRQAALSHELFATVTDELRRLATVIFNDSSAQRTLQPTALVN